MTGVGRLRGQRGEQKASFSEIADHIVDFARRNPMHAIALDAFAGFLASVERTPHDHEPEDASSLTGRVHAQSRR